MSAVLKPELQLLDRTKYLGSSDAAAILGISPWRTPLDVYLDKIQPRVEDLSPGRMKVLTRGKRMEPYVIDLLAEETGLVIIGRGNRYRDQRHPFIAAEIDAEAESGENIEIKTVSPFKAREWGEQQTDEVPLHYTAQAMHALMVTDKQLCVLGVLIGGDDFRIYRVERDDETIDAIREMEVAFWDRVQRLEPPEATTVSDVMRLYGRDAGTAVEATEAIERDVLALRSIKGEIKKLEESQVEREDRIKVYLGEAAILTVHGRPALTWKSQEARRFDQTAFKAAHPDLVEAFTKVSTSRVLRLK